MGQYPAHKGLGYYVGRAHFFRDRGAGYVDSARTSIQAGFIAAGVLLGAGFMNRKWSAIVGVSLTLGLELAKIALGWLDRHIGAIHEQQRQNWETNPATVRQIELLEEIAKRLADRP